MPARSIAAVLAVVALGLGGCGGASSTSAAAACGADVSEALDARSAQHVLPGAPEPAYATDPPSSGAHQPGADVHGVLTSALSRPVQVTVLEEGGVLLQHRNLAAADQQRLEALAGGEVVVAPNPGLASAVVATAWGHRLTCRSVDVDALSRFVTAHQGRGAG